jgi:hypothetical protein
VIGEGACALAAELPGTPGSSASSKPATAPAFPNRALKQTISPSQGCIFNPLNEPAYCDEPAMPSGNRLGTEPQQAGHIATPPSTGPGGITCAWNTENEGRVRADLSFGFGHADHCGTQSGTGQLVPGTFE